MSKVYEITDDTWWDSNGCSCCEPYEMPLYNVDFEDFPVTGSHSRTDLEQIYYDILVENGIYPPDLEYNDDEGNDDRIDEMSKQAEHLCGMNGFIVEVVRD